MPSLTVLMPVYNAREYLCEAVRSVLSQTIDDFQLFLLDDGSTDGGIESIAELGDPRIVVMRSDTNIGLGATLTRGLDACHTEYFVRMDADDVIQPEKFAKQITFLRENPNIGLVGTQFHYFGTAGATVISPRLPTTHDAIIMALRRQALALIHGSLMGRTAILKKAGGYRVQGMGEDWDMFLRVGEISVLANLPDDLYSWRLHGGNAKLRHLMEQQQGIQFACDCADRRAQGIPEQSYDDFCESHLRQSIPKRLAKFIDLYALAQYRIALTTISRGSRIGGYARLGYAAACSPFRTATRIRRMLSTERSMR